jgi:M6 family metalloprotease-like protein
MQRVWIVVLALVAGCGSGGHEVDDAAGDRPATQLRLSLALPIVKVGGKVAADVTALDASGAATAVPSIAWSASPAELAAVDSTGVITAVAAGEATITATSGALQASASLEISADPVAACRLSGPQFGVGLGFPRIANRAPTTGDVHIKVLFVDFSDAVATRTPQQVMGILSPGAEQFYAAVSAGRMHLVFDPVYTWLRMSKPTSGYPWDPLTFDGQKAYIQEAVQLAGNLDVSTTDAFVVIANPDVTAFAYGPAFVANPGDGYTAGPRAFDNGATSGNDMTRWGSGWFNHEFGHAMGLIDLYELGIANPQTFHYTGGFSMMGNILGRAPEYLGWERWLLGWVDDDAVLCTSPGQSAAILTPVELAGGAKIVVVPTGATTALVVESRRAMGYDHALSGEGLLVYSIDTSISTGAGAVKVLPIKDSDYAKTSALIGVGDSLTQGGVTITHVAQDTAGDHITVSY